MIGRITNHQQLASATRNLQTSRALLAHVQEQASSGRTISRPSDDPAGTAAAMRVRTEQRAVEQYGSNITDGLAWLATADNALSSSASLLHQVRDLTVRGANSGTMTPASREALAADLEGLRSDLLQQANTSYLGRTIFAGNSDAGSAFTTTAAVPPATAPTYAFTGGADAPVTRRISAAESVTVDVNGGATFGDGAGSVFALLDSIVADLRAGAEVSARITEVDAALTRVTTQQAVVGTRYARMERAQDANLSQSIALETQRSGIEDVDPAKVIIDLKSQELTYQTALAVTARALQPTLLDYLR
ncbi:MAG: flagellar hook-associated protein 3 [Naasia sp.]|nr:flagellar hook-associated protein 3 [Naasia sp.]